MRHRHNQFDVAHTLSPDFFLGYLYTAAVADDTFVPDSLVLSAMTLPVLDRTKNSFTEETIHLRFVCPVVDGFWLGYLPVRTLENGFGRSQTYGNFRKVLFYFFVISKSHNTLVQRRLSLKMNELERCGKDARKKLCL
jgi:hypothetical protein